MKAPNKNEVINFLTSQFINNHQYMVTGEYEETPNKTVAIQLTTHSLDAVHQEYMNAFEAVQEGIYERECADQYTRDAVESQYDEATWEEMDEDERDEVIGDYVIEEYCDSNAIDERIDLVYHDFHKVIQALIDWDLEEDEWTENELPEDGLIMIDDKAAMVVSEPQLQFTDYDVDVWTPAHGERSLEATITMEYCVDVLIDGEVCSYPLYTKDFELYVEEGGQLDWEVCA